MNEQIAFDYIGFYLNGLISRRDLSSFADKLLYSSFKERSLSLDPELFHALMCASELGSVYSKDEMTKLHRKLQNYLKKYTS